MRWLWRSHWRWFVVLAALGVALRLLFVFRFPLVQGDTLIYADIAKNWLQHGVYGLGQGDDLHPTLIRLPGYPAFLAACFALFGAEHYRAVMLVQTAMDMVTAWLVAAITWELWRTPDESAARSKMLGHKVEYRAELRTDRSRQWGFLVGWNGRATLAAFALYCLFPYTANYVSQPMAETPTLFAIALALSLALRGLRSRSLAHWIGCGLATAVCAVLRPEGGLLLVTLLLYLLWRRQWRPIPVLLLCTALVLTPWTLRNHRTFGVWQPLVPQNATDPGEFYPQGFTDWTKTWLLEYCSVYEIAWNVPGEAIDASLLPSRAFDSAEQRQTTLQMIAQYNESNEIDAGLDAEFATLARERRQAHPLRHYVMLPLGRELDMWLRPRTDSFPIEVRWWQYWRVPKETAFAAAYSLIGLAVLTLAAVGFRRSRMVAEFSGLLALYVVLRSLFLLTAATAEPRYTIECFPMVLVFAAVALAKPVEVHR